MLEKYTTKYLVSVEFGNQRLTCVIEGYTRFETAVIFLEDLLQHSLPDSVQDMSSLDSFLAAYSPSIMFSIE